MERKIRSIRVRTEKGRDVVLDEYQEFIDGRDKNCIGEVWVPGPKRLELRGGGAVSFIDANTFQVVSSGQILTTI